MARKHVWYTNKNSKPEVVRAWADEFSLSVSHEWPLCFCVLFKSGETSVVHKLVCMDYEDVFSHGHVIRRYERSPEGLLFHPYRSDRGQHAEERLKIHLNRLETALERLGYSLLFSTENDPYNPGMCATYFIYPKDWPTFLNVCLPQEVPMREGLRA
ncbi:hypothetical protein OHS59_16300 [Streptomyces sp. NBC_00414]|uniref:hypothetical protein n=1 Tax=Streptomyces sp. NBC_00414 TaxID=2975739 RepID=UPI002E20664A